MNTYSAYASTSGPIEPKCPCCSIPLHVADLRPVQLITVIPPVANHHIKFIKLHRSKVCPAPFLPITDQPRRSSPRAAPSQADADAPFCKFNYVDPERYQQHLTANLQELLEGQLELDGTGRLSCSLAIELVQTELQAALEEVSKEVELMERFASPAAGIYQSHPRQLLAETYTSLVAAGSGSDAVDACPLDSVAFKDSTGVPAGVKVSVSASASIESPVSPRYRGDSIGSAFSFESADAQRRARGDSIASHDTDAPQSPKGKNRRMKYNPVATMYIDNDESVFYQTEDGQLCFLSGFNMKCLQTEFSATLPDETLLLSSLSLSERRKINPLPDVIEGTIVEVDRVQLTPEMRQRLRFLSHLPLYSDIAFVEIGLGNMLSHETKKAFKKDFNKRKQTRMSKATAEKREDERARRKEEARINDLKARMSRIDPSDEFFQALPYIEPPVDFTGDDFAPLVQQPSGDGVSTRQPGPAPMPADPMSSFSTITRVGGSFPALGTTQGERDFPTLGANGPPRRAPQSQSQPSWGRPTKPIVEREPVRMPAPTAGKKKSKSKKVLLFSTGSHRGGS